MRESEITKLDYWIISKAAIFIFFWPLKQCILKLKIAVNEALGVHVAEALEYVEAIGLKLFLVLYRCQPLYTDVIRICFK
jgi:hypothetical protein